jgi:TolB protein
MMLRIFALVALMFAAPVAAQTDAPRAAGLPMVAIPPLPTPKVEQTAAGQTHAIGLQVAEVIAADLRASGVVAPVGPANLRVYSYPEVTGPMFQQWQSIGARSLVTGFVQKNSEDLLTIGCYLYDIPSRREITRKGFRVPVREWRRAAHRCADAVYSGLTGRPGIYDTRIVYVAEGGPAANRQKRLAIMDSDGSNHRFLTEGATTVISPNLSPDATRVAYTAFEGRMPQVRIVETEGGADRPLLPNALGLTFAPSFSPDGRRILFSMATNGNTDLYIVDADGGVPQRLTSTPGVDTSGSFSPDGSKIVFESDRSGTSQIYVMNADGSDQRRISFGAGRYGAPVWSPQGDMIAFSRGNGIGVMTAAGADERMLTANPFDDAPSWGASGQTLIFHRRDAGRGTISLMSVGLEGGEARVRLTPQDGSDADWSKVPE